MKKIINFVKTYTELAILLTVVVLSLVVFINQQHEKSVKATRENLQDYNLMYLPNY